MGVSALHRAHCSCPMKLCTFLLDGRPQAGLVLPDGIVNLSEALGAAFMQTVRISTVNFQTFSEIAFRFHFTPGIAAQALLFALAMGVVGGFIPAWRASRMKIVDCLREA